MRRSTRSFDADAQVLPCAARTRLMCAGQVRRSASEDATNCLADMSNFWKLRRQFVGDGTPLRIDWPADVELIFRLKPGDLFGVINTTVPRSSIVGETKFSLDGNSGKFMVLDTGLLPAMNFDALFQEGTLTIRGQEAVLKATVQSEAKLEILVNWISASLSQLLSVQLGSFVDIESLSGVVAGQNVSALFPAESYSLLLASVDISARHEKVQSALFSPSIENPSYPRLIASTRYFHHALRIVAPQEVSYVPYCVYAEVVLNLAKSIEILFGPSRDQLRARLGELGYSNTQVETQIVPIMVVRNDMDVGHPSSGDAYPGEVAVLRKFVDRAIQNVTTLLQNVSQHICQNPSFLTPLSNKGETDRANLVAKLEAYLVEPKLNPGTSTPIIFSAT